MASGMTRRLGRSGMSVSAMGVGCWAIGGPFWEGETPLGWGQVDDAESERAIQRALDLGVTLFDTADVYGAGQSERVLGRALGSRRREVVIATKFGLTFDESARQVTGTATSPTYVRQACEASLRRLGTDVIDLYQFHLNDFDAAQAAEVRDVLEELVAAGKIRCHGWSTDFPERARVFAQAPHCAAFQHQMNVFDDAAELIAVCDEADCASINRGPLAMGLLTGKYDAGTRIGAGDVRGLGSPEWMRYFKGGRPAPEWLERLAALRELLTSGGRTLAQGAVGWLWARSPRTIPIPGVRTLAQVEENCAALQRGPLAPETMDAIEALRT